MKKTKIIRLIHRGTGGQQGWIYSIEGLISTIPASNFKDPPKIIVQNRKRVTDEQNTTNRKFI